MEGGEVKKKNSGKRRSMDFPESPSVTETAFKKSPRKVVEASDYSLEGSVRKSFNLEQEVSRQDEIVEFLRSNEPSVDGIGRLGESTMRLLCEIRKIADARGPGDRMNVQLPSVSIPIPYPEVIVAMKHAIEGLIDDVEEVKNKVLSRKKSTTPRAHAVTAAGKGLQEKKWNVVLQEVSRNFCQQHGKPREPKQEKKAENVEPEKVVTQEDGDVLLQSEIAVTTKLPCFETRLNQDNSRMRRKRPRIMCQNCLDKPRNSVILRCKHSLHCNECLKACQEKINNCPGCGKDNTDIVYDNLR